MAENANVLANNDEFSDWIELYNTTAAPVDIGGWYIREVEDTGSGTDTNFFRFPAVVPIPGFGRLLVWCDDLTNSPGFHTMFALPKSGTALDLLLPNSSLVPGAGVSFGLQVEDLTIGRVPDGGAWALNLPTPGSNNVAYPAFGSITDLRINEWSATNNINGDTTNDWLEVFNLSTNPVALASIIVSDRLPPSLSYHAITNLSFIGGEDFIRFWCDDKRKPCDHVNFGLSSTSGETLYLFASDRITILDQISFPGNNTVPNYWLGNMSYGRLPDGGPLYPDRFISPTPSDSNWQLMTNIVINEVLTHTDPPLEDAIELRNTTDEWVDISHWWISNKRNTPKMFRIPPDTMIPPQGYYVFYEYLGATNQFPRPGFNTSGEREPGDFTLNSAHGDQVWIFSGSNDVSGTLTGLRGGLEFGPVDNGVSFGPVVNSAGETEVVPQRQRTFGGALNPISVQQFRQGTGAPNTAGPRFGPIVVTEIYYHPPDILRPGQPPEDNDLHEFVEVYNSATTNVLMYDPVHYGYADGRTNTWRLRGIVDEDFPGDFVMSPGQIVLFVNFSPTNAVALNDFRNRFNVPDHIRLFGPYSANLDNGSGDVEIRRPDTPQPPGRDDAGHVPYVIEDRVEYDDDPPWPTLADGVINIPDPGGIHVGFSLQRIVIEDYGDDPINWIATTPTPGRQPIRIEPLIRSGDSLTIRFRAWAGSGYTVQYNSTLSSTGWTKLTDVAPLPTSGVRQVSDSNVAANVARYYRIVSPIQ